jgi:hypothetical protein
MWHSPHPKPATVKIRLAGAFRGLVMPSRSQPEAKSIPPANKPAWRVVMLRPDRRRGSSFLRGTTTQSAPRCQTGSRPAARVREPIYSRNGNWLMTDSTDTLARSLVRNLYYATEGRTWWWSLPHKMSGATWDGIQRATDRGWMLRDGNSVCLTDAGRELVEKPAPQIGGLHWKGLSDQSKRSAMEALLVR